MRKESEFEKLLQRHVCRICRKPGRDVLDQSRTKVGVIELVTWCGGCKAWELVRTTPEQEGRYLTADFGIYDGSLSVVTRRRAGMRPPPRLRRRD